MAKDHTEVIKYKKKDNKTDTAVSVEVEQVVVNDRLVPDIREANPGVIIGNPLLR